MGRPRKPTIDDIKTLIAVANGPRALRSFMNGYLILRSANLSSSREHKESVMREVKDHAPTLTYGPEWVRLAEAIIPMSRSELVEFNETVSALLAKAISERVAACGEHVTMH